MTIKELIELLQLHKDNINNFQIELANTHSPSQIKVELNKGVVWLVIE